jgi:hypothetical protein
MLTSPRILSEHAWSVPRWADGTPAPYALDNGAWGAHQQGTPFDEAAFELALAAVGRGADWVVAPDVVGGGLYSLSVTRAWLPKLAGLRLVLVAVQDGMQPADVVGLLGPRCGLFLGGTTEWKLNTLNLWGQLAARVGCYFHVGRVNTARRIRACKQAGADSYDGTSVTKFPSTLPLLDSARRQLNLYTDK